MGDEIDRMVKEAEQFAEEDKKVKGKVEAKNSLENYLYSMKNTVTDQKKLGEKISEEDKTTVLEAVEEVSSGSMPTSMLTRRLSRRSRRRSRASATLSFLSSTRL